jgi:hypothetical protein
MNSNWKNKLIVTSTSRNQETRQFIDNNLIHLLKCKSTTDKHWRETKKDKKSEQTDEEEYEIDKEHNSEN